MTNDNTQHSPDITCPLCQSKANKQVKRYDVEALKKDWQKQHQYNPFAEATGYFHSYRCAKCSILHFDPNYIGNEDLYRHLGTKSWYYEKNKWEFIETMKLCKRLKPSSIFEIGCGNGDFLSLISSHVKHAEGVDINKTAVALCQSRNLNASTKPLSEINLKYDMVVAFQVFEHLEEVKKVLEQSIKLLTPKGALVIAVPNPDGYLKAADSNLLNLPPHHSLHFSKKTFQSISETYGLELLQYDTQPIRLNHYRSYQSALLKRSAATTSVLARKIRALINRTMIYPMYLMKRDKKSLGHTHMCVLRLRS